LKLEKTHIKDEIYDIIKF